MCCDGDSFTTEEVSTDNEPELNKMSYQEERLGRPERARHDRIHNKV